MRRSLLAVAVVMTLGCEPTTPPGPRYLTVMSLSAGFTHTCALDPQGVAWCWGYGRRGELGVDTTSLYGVLAKRPMRVNTDLRFTSIAAGSGFTCALTGDGTPYCWGSNVGGRLGNASLGGGCSSPCSSVPVPVAGGHRFTRLFLGAIACGIEASGKLFCWGGEKGTGLLGPSAPDPDSSAVPVEITPDDGSVVSWESGSTSYNTACATTTTHRVACWGSNVFGGLGIGDTLPPHVAQPRFVATPALLRGVAVRFFGACALDEQNRAFCWGDNQIGTLGTGSDNHLSCRFGRDCSPAPVEVQTSAQFTSLTGGTENFCALTAGGALYCWGNIPGGSVTVNARTPTEMPTSWRFATISTLGSHTCAIGLNGLAYCWGYNNVGQAIPTIGYGFISTPTPISHP